MRGKRLMLGSRWRYFDPITPAVQKSRETVKSSVEGILSKQFPPLQPHSKTQAILWDKRTRTTARFGVS
jgi:hypothetical protein